MKNLAFIFLIFFIASSSIVLAKHSDVEVASKTLINKNKLHHKDEVRTKGKSHHKDEVQVKGKSHHKDKGKSHHKDEVQVKGKSHHKDEGKSHHKDEVQVKGKSHHNPGHHNHYEGYEFQVLETKTKASDLTTIGGEKLNKGQLRLPHETVGDDEEEEGEEEGLAPIDKSKIHVPILVNREPKPDIDSFSLGFLGSWDVQNEFVGVNAMQLQLMPNNKAVWFDTTTLGPSATKLQGINPGNCPISFETNLPDCFAHAISYNIENGAVRTLKVEGDPWCSSGGLGPNGDLIGTGGNAKATKTVRIISPCDNCEFKERHYALGAGRWYSTQQILEDGSIIVVGGRGEFSYDLMPPQLDFQPKVFNLPFLKETTEPALHIDRVPYENNLYPFVFLVPDGNVFLFANNRSILFNPYNGKTLNEYPPLAGGARNYPPSGMSALLPFKLDKANPNKVEAEVVVCGGNHPFAFSKVDKKHTNEKVFLPALQDCWRIKVHDPKPQWVREQDMPHRRTMADLLHLPNGDLLFINGAQKGTSGWEDGEDPNLVPVLYRPYKPMGQRFVELEPTDIPRMYHSSSALLPRGNILVAGSNPHQFYTLNGTYPTEMKVELFWPPYLDPSLNELIGTRINEEASTKQFKYGGKFTVSFSFVAESPVEFAVGELKVTMIAPPFTTHGFCQNQRMMILALEDVKVDEKLNGVTVTALAPASGKIAPPGYYLLFVVVRHVPSPGIWVHLS